MLIGGSSKNNKFDKNDIINLKNIVNKISNNMKANIIATTSRRTDDLAIKELSKLDNISYFLNGKSRKKIHIMQF